MSADKSKLIASLITVLCFVSVVVFGLYATRQSGYESGYSIGHTQGVIEGRGQVIDEFEKALGEAIKAAEGRAELERFKSEEMARRARKEIQALGLSQAKAKQELAAYLADKHEDSGKSDNGNAGNGLYGGVDPDVVRLLNEARAAATRADSD